MADSEDPLKVEATTRLEWFVVGLLFKLTRADIEQTLQSTRDSYGPCSDSYARGVIGGLLGGWSFERYVSAKVGEKHAELLAELAETKKQLSKATSLLSSGEYLAGELRSLADRLDPPKKDE